MKRFCCLKSVLSILLALSMVLGMLCCVLPTRGYAEGEDPTTEQTQPQERDSTEPSQPAESEPTEPAATEPSESTEPSDATEPSAPENPTEPANPTDPTEPSDPTAPTEPEEMDPADQEKLEELKGILGDLESQEADLMAQITGLMIQQHENMTLLEATLAEKILIDQEITLLYARLENADQQILTYNELISGQRIQLVKTRAELAELNRINRERIRTMEAEGTMSYWSVIFKSTSFSDLLDRIAMIHQIQKADRRRIQQMNQLAEDIATTQLEIRMERDALQYTKANIEVIEADLSARQAEAALILEELNAQGEEFALLIGEGEEQVIALMDELAVYADEYMAITGEEFTSSLGGEILETGWVSPCEFIYVSSEFSPGRMHPVLGYVRPHNGIDLAASTGTPIYATRSGIVTKTAYQAEGAGNYVSIAHGDGYASVYMHMQRYIVTPGQQVQAGQLIGYVGSTGVSTGPHLHFGISYQGTYVDPAPFIGIVQIPPVSQGEE